MSQKMGKVLRSVFLVTNPDDDSEFVDVVAEVDTLHLGNIAIGLGASKWYRAKPALHSDRQSAHRDAITRLQRLHKGQVPDWVFSSGTSIPRMAAEVPVSEEKRFFDNPEKREVREFALSKAPSNDPQVEQEALEGEEPEVQGEAPPTPTEIVEEPGGSEFSTLNRFVVETEEPIPGFGPQGYEELPKHPDLSKEAVRLIAAWGPLVR